MGHQTRLDFDPLTPYVDVGGNRSGIREASVYEPSWDQQQTSEWRHVTSTKDRASAHISKMFREWLA